MPRKVGVAFAVLGGLALLMCGVLVYLGKAKWVAIILGLHALVAVLWYSIRAVRPYRSDPLNVFSDYKPTKATPPPHVVEIDWATPPPVQREKQADDGTQEVLPHAKPVQKDWNSQPPPARNS